jgi:copper transport protein
MSGLPQRSQQRIPLIHRRVSLLQRLVFAIIAIVGLSRMPAASAHAQLVKTDPSQGAKLDEAPAAVRVEFDERIDDTSAGIKVFAADAHRVDNAVTKVTGIRAEVALVTDLPDGAYVAVWQAVSGDGHPVRGSFTFQVGEGDQAAINALGERELLSNAVDPFVQRGLRLFRFLSFAGVAVLLAAGVWTLVGNKIPFGPYINIATAVGLASGVCAVLLDGPYVEGRSISGIISAQTLINSLGRVTVRALLGAVVVSFFLSRAVLRKPASKFEIGASVAIVSLLLGSSGHAAAGNNVVPAILITAVHVLAGSTWVGGLVLLALSLRSTTPAQFSQQSLLRWSSVAQVAVAVLVLSGSFNAWRQVGTTRALTTTWYGKLFMLKLGLVACMVLAGAWHRRRIATNSIGRRTVITEAAVGLLVLLISSLLASTIPARAAVSRPLLLRVATTTSKSDITIDPARAGMNTLHIYVFDKSGVTKDIADAAFVLTHIATGTVIEVNPLAAGRGHQEARVVEIPFAGTWQLLAKIYVTEFDVETTLVTFQISP